MCGKDVCSCTKREVTCLHQLYAEAVRAGRSEDRAEVSKLGAYSAYSSRREMVSASLPLIYSVGTMVPPRSVKSMSDFLQTKSDI